MRRTYFMALGVLLVTGSLLPAQQRSPEAILKRLDKNNNGRLEKAELPRQVQARFEAADANKDGSLDLKELGTLLARRRPGGANRRPGEVNTPPARGERHSDNLKVGMMAPDFKLPTMKGKEEIKLSSYRGKKPVVLIFGSYT